MWHKTDDGFHSHRKARAVRRSHPEKRRDSAPFGLWILAASWCGDNPEQNGFVPLEVLEEWDDNAETLARRLVNARLWIEATQDGEKGYAFHDWEEYNGPDDSAIAGAFGNHKRWHIERGILNPDCEHCQKVVVDDPSGRLAPDDRPDIGSGIAPESLPVPTRPDPTNRNARSARASATFDDFWKLYPRKVGKRKAQTAWKTVTKQHNADEIVDGLREQLPSLAMKRTTEGDFRPHPTTWLSQGRWMDEPEQEMQAQRSHLPEAWR